MNVATVFSFLYISSVPEIKGKCATFFLAYICREDVFPTKHTFVDLQTFICSGIFILFLFSFAKIKGRMSESWTKTNFLPYRYFIK